MSGFVRYVARNEGMPASAPRNRSRLLSAMSGSAALVRAESRSGKISLHPFAPSVVHRSSRFFCACPASRIPHCARRSGAHVI